MRSMIFASVLALSSLAAIPAFADHSGGQGGANFPMPAAQFKQRVDARIAKMREHVEARAKNLSADQAKELRANFDNSVAKMNAEVAKAIADGTVTKDEARAVRAASPHGRGGKGGHCAGNKS